jgi:hypothetical protein
VELFLLQGGEIRSMGQPREFQVKPVPTTPPGTDFQAVADFQYRVSDLARRISGASAELSRAGERLRHMRAALIRTPKADPSLFRRVDELMERVNEFSLRLSGDRVRSRMNEATVPSISGRVGNVQYGHWNTRMEPTETMRESVDIAASQFEEFMRGFTTFIEVELPALEQDLADAGAPWTPGRKLPGG